MIALAIAAVLLVAWCLARIARIPPEITEEDAERILTGEPEVVRMLLEDGAP